MNILNILYKSAEFYKGGEVSPLEFSSKEEKLLAAKCLRKANKVADRWTLDWKVLGMTSKEGERFWLDHQVSYDASTSTNVIRKRSWAIQPELFDTLTEEAAKLITKGKKPVPLVQEIFDKTGLIINRDTIKEYTPENKVSITQARNIASLLSVDEKEELAEYLYRSVNASRGTYKVMMETPQAFKDAANEILKKASKVTNFKSDVDKIELMTYLGILGFAPYTIHSKVREDETYYFKGIICDKVTEYRDYKYLGLALPEADISFARCLEKDAIKWEESHLSHAFYSFKGLVSDPHGISGEKLYKAIMAGWNKDTVMGWLNNKDNLKPYHLKRRSAKSPWEINYSAIAISMYMDNILIHPLLLKGIQEQKKVFEDTKCFLNI